MRGPHDSLPHARPSEEVVGFIQSIRGEITLMDTQNEWNQIIFSSSVASLLGFSRTIKDLCRGRVSWGLKSGRYLPIPDNQFEDTCLEIRKRKGLGLKIPTVKDLE